MIRHAKDTKWPPWEAPLANSAEEERQKEIDAAMECLMEDVQRCRDRDTDPFFSEKLMGMMRRMDYCYDVVCDALSKDQTQAIQRTLRAARVFVAGIGFGSHESEEDESDMHGTNDRYDSLLVHQMDVWTSGASSFPKMHTCTVVPLCDLKGGLKVAVLVLTDPTQHPQRAPYLLVMPEYQYKKDVHAGDLQRHLDMEELIDAYNRAHYRARSAQCINSLQENLQGIRWAVAEMVCRKGAFDKRTPDADAIHAFKVTYANFRHELMDAQWDSLRDRAGVYLYYCHHARVIQQRFRNSMSNPAHPMCRRRLMREFSEFEN